MATSAIHALCSAFNDSFYALGQDRGHDRDVVVVSWPSVPVEVIRAAGFTPVFARGSTAATPAADQVLEPGVFPVRIRHLLQAAITGRLAHVAAIVMPRTSDADYKAYLYLQELRRRGRLDASPPVLLFDLLQSQGPDAALYDSERVRDLFLQLAALRDAQVATDVLRQQIALGNGARAAARRLATMRRKPARARGSEMLPLLGARWTVPPERYALLADEALQAMAGRATLAGPRVLLAGTPADSTLLHVAIEALHATVVDEVSPFGADIAAGDIAATEDPFGALAAWYRLHSITARMPAATLMSRFEASLADIDAAIIALPADDARFGWDYPRLREVLDGRGIIHAVVSGDSSVDRGRMFAVLSRGPGLQAVRHG